MPTVKNPKSPKHHPPCNRAFALRMMQSNQYVEGRISPLDRALKPIKDSLKRASKSKRKERAQSSSSDGSGHLDLSAGDINAEDIDSSFEVPSPSPCEEVDAQKDYDRMNGGSKGRRAQQQDYPMDGNTAIRNGKYDRPHRMRGGNSRIMDPSLAGMEDIDEEDEVDASNDQAYHDFQYYRQVGYKNNNSHSKEPHYYDHSNNSMRENPWSSHVPGTNQTQLQHDSKRYEKQPSDDDMMFVTSNGDVVKLRKKRDSKEASKMTESEDKRAERFGKRLSLLCHMLAEKYPEDFHILELLVELQVSNEKREEEMNQSVLNLQQKVDSMEQRLSSIERLSLPGFQQTLLPLANAASMFYDGLKKSIDTAQHICQIEGTSKNSSSNMDGEIKSDFSSGKLKPKEESRKSSSTSNGDDEKRPGTIVENANVIEKPTEEIHETDSDSTNNNSSRNNPDISTATIKKASEDGHETETSHEIETSHETETSHEIENRHEIGTRTKIAEESVIKECKTLENLEDQQTPSEVRPRNENENLEEITGKLKNISNEYEIIPDDQVGLISADNGSNENGRSENGLSCDSGMRGENGVCGNTASEINRDVDQCKEEVIVEEKDESMAREELVGKANANDGNASNLDGSSDDKTEIKDIKTDAEKPKTGETIVNSPTLSQVNREDKRSSTSLNCEAAFDCVLTSSVSDQSISSKSEDSHSISSSKSTEKTIVIRNETTV